MQYRKLALAIVAIGCLAVASVSFAAETFTAKVTSVKDGDSLVVSHKGRTVDVILAGVSAPSLRSEHGAEARADLHRLHDLSY